MAEEHHHHHQYHHHHHHLGEDFETVEMTLPPPIKSEVPRHGAGFHFNVGDMDVTGEKGTFCGEGISHVEVKDSDFQAPGKFLGALMTQEDVEGGELMETELSLSPPKTSAPHAQLPTGLPGVFLTQAETDSILEEGTFSREGIGHVEAKDYDYRGHGQFPGVFTVQPSLDTYDKGKDEAEEETDNEEHQYKIGGDN